MSKEFWDMLGIAGLVIFAGYVMEKYVLVQLCKAAKQTRWEFDDIIFNALKGRVGKWGVLLGVYILADVIPLPEELLDFLRHGILVLFILSVTCLLSECASAIINVYAKKTPKVFPSTSIFTNLTSSLVFIIGIVFILQSLGISVAPLITALGVGGLAVALALQDTLSNFFAGLHLLAARPVRPGDYIRLDSDEEGYVLDITWRNTSIRDLKQNMIIVPNSKMTEAKIVNYNLPEKHMMIYVPLAVSFESDLEKVEATSLAVAREVMREANGGVCDFQPAIRFHTFGEFGVEFNVMLCVKQFSAQYYVRHAFIKEIKKRFKSEGIVLPESMHTIRIKT